MTTEHLLTADSTGELGPDNASIIDQHCNDAISEIAKATHCEEPLAAFDLIVCLIMRLGVWQNDEIDPQSAWDELSAILRRVYGEGLDLGKHPKANEFSCEQPEMTHVSN